MLNGLGGFRTEIDGLGIHFLHVRSPQADALPMVMTHGWPGSVVEFHKVVAPLTDPTAHGGDASDAFHLVIPSLPGYGFSDKPSAPGWGLDRTARAWAVLMGRLGYGRYVAQGGDWGAAVSDKLAMARPAGFLAVHLNTLFEGPQPGDERDPSGEGRASEPLHDQSLVAPASSGRESGHGGGVAGVRGETRRGFDLRGCRMVYPLP